MSNLYNEEFKKWFISTYDKSTQISLYYIFQKSAELERILNKDVYEFNREELDELFLSFGCKSQDSIASKISIIGKYIQFALDKNQLKTGINLVENISGEEYYKKYVSKVAEQRKILSKEEFDNLIDNCYNDQDKALFMLLYVGCRGRQVKEHELEELRNLKWEDVDEENNTITVTRDNGETRTLKVDTKVIDILEAAYKQDEYYKNNGEVSEWMQIRKNTKMKLLDTGYILKPTKKGEFGKITKGTIAQRLITIKESYGNPFITITNIWLSGMVEYGKQIKKEKGSELDREDYKEICRRFGHDEVYWNKIKQRIQKYI